MRYRDRHLKQLPPFKEGGEPEPGTGREIMEEKKTIAWESDLKEALKKAASEDKPVLLDFFSPG